MMMVKTRLAQSAIEGLGLFAQEDIPKGTVTWRFVPGFDQTFTAEDIANLPEPAHQEMLRYTYFHQRTGRYVACLDNARFMNHDDKPNTAGAYDHEADEGYDVATRDIKKGEELTCDYATFDADINFKLGIAAEPASLVHLRAGANGSKHTNGSHA
jgi:SET domain-containing protein